MFWQKGQPGPSKEATGSQYVSSFEGIREEFTEFLSDESYLLNAFHFSHKSSKLAFSFL